MQNNIFAQKINSLSKFSKVLGKMPQMPGDRMQSVQKPQDAEDTANELYDVDRWREAERQAEWDRDIIGTSGSNIEQVRRKWNKASDADDDDADDIYGSSAARDSASERRSERDVRVNSVYARINRQDVGPVTDAREGIHSGSTGRNPLGLSVCSGIDGFFSSNPINSCLLAGDSLSMGYLSLNQTVADRYGLDAEDSERSKLGADAVNDGEAGSYMQKRREESARKKENIKIL